MEQYHYVVADVFTETPLKGNPVAVFTNARGLETEQMQKIANEMHLSETVFVCPAKNGGDVLVRIFTPVNELPFAGHPTLGTAIVLGERLESNRILMETGMGMVPFLLVRDADGIVRSAAMQQPIPEWEAYDRADDVLLALGLNASDLPVDIYRNGPRHAFVGCGSIERLSALKPDYRILDSLPDVAINCFAGSGSYWRMRMFSPAYGVFEDAATGSAAGPLAIHLARHGRIDLEQPIEILQGVEIGRPSIMRARIFASGGEIQVVEVSGAAVIIIRGCMEL